MASFAIPTAGTPYQRDFVDDLARGVRLGVVMREQGRRDDAAEVEAQQRAANAELASTLGEASEFQSALPGLSTGAAPPPAALPGVGGPAPGGVLPVGGAPGAAPGGPPPVGIAAGDPPEAIAADNAVKEQVSAPEMQQQAREMGEEFVKSKGGSPTTADWAALRKKVLTAAAATGDTAKILEAHEFLNSVQYQGFTQNLNLASGLMQINPEQAANYLKKAYAYFADGNNADFAVKQIKVPKPGGQEVTEYAVLVTPTPEKGGAPLPPVPLTSSGINKIIQQFTNRDKLFAMNQEHAQGLEKLAVEEGAAMERTQANIEAQAPSRAAAAMASRASAGASSEQAATSRQKREEAERLSKLGQTPVSALPTGNEQTLEQQSMLAKIANDRRLASGESSASKDVSVPQAIDDRAYALNVLAKLRTDTEQLGFMARGKGATPEMKAAYAAALSDLAKAEEYHREAKARLERAQSAVGGQQVGTPAPAAAPIPGMENLTPAQRASFNADLGKLKQFINDPSKREFAIRYWKQKYGELPPGM